MYETDYRVLAGQAEKWKCYDISSFLECYTPFQTNKATILRRLIGILFNFVAPSLYVVVTW